MSFSLKISEAQIVSGPPVSCYQEKLSFLSPDQNQIVSFRPEGEIRMGTPSYSVWLGEKSQSVEEYTRLGFPNIPDKLMVTRASQPWTWDGNSLLLEVVDRVAYHSLTFPLRINLQKKTTELFPIQGYSFVLLPSLKFPIAFAVADQKAHFFNVEEKIKIIQQFDLSADYINVASFFKKSEKVLILAQSIQDRNYFPRLQVYSPNSDRVLVDLSLNPLDFFPYPHEEYQSIQGLLLSEGGSGSVSLLDTWSESYFLENENLLYLKTFRPTEALRKDNLCRVKECWVKVSLVDD